MTRIERAPPLYSSYVKNRERGPLSSLVIRRIESHDDDDDDDDDDEDADADDDDDDEMIMMLMMMMMTMMGSILLMTRIESWPPRYSYYNNAREALSLFLS